MGEISVVNLGQARLTTVHGSRPLGRGSAGQCGPTHKRQASSPDEIPPLKTQSTFRRRTPEPQREEQFEKLPTRHNGQLCSVLHDLNEDGRGPARSAKQIVSGTALPSLRQVMGLACVPAGPHEEVPVCLRVAFVSVLVCVDSTMSYHVQSPQLPTLQEAQAGSAHRFEAIGFSSPAQRSSVTAIPSCKHVTERLAMPSPQVALHVE